MITRSVVGLLPAIIATIMFFAANRAKAQAATQMVVPGTSPAALFTPPPNLPKADANGNPIRFAPRTGHVSNYDEAKVAPYTLPNPLVMSDGGEGCRHVDEQAAGGNPQALSGEHLRAHPGWHAQGGFRGGVRRYCGTQWHRAREASGRAHRAGGRWISPARGVGSCCSGYLPPAER